MQHNIERSLQDMDRASLFHPLTSIAEHMKSGSAIYTSARGVHVQQEQGRELIDMAAGLWCVNVGYGRVELADAAAHAMRQLSFQHLFGAASSQYTIELADRLLRLFRERAHAPHMARVFFGTSGSDANDTALKLVRYYNNLLGRPAKKKIISRIGAYHGVNQGSGSLTGIASYHRNFDLPTHGILYAACPHYYGYSRPGESEAHFTDRLIADLELLIRKEGAETIAAFIAEPVMGTGGVFLPPPGYFPRVQELLEKYEILFIVDEVITGFGRLGEWFGTGAYSLRPDIVSLAKGLTSGYFPMSASVVSQRIWSVLESESDKAGTFMHGYTYSGHPVGSAVAMANLDVMERENLVENAARTGRYLLDSLRVLVGEHPYVGDIRGAGLMVGIEFVADRGTHRGFGPAQSPHRIVAAHSARAGVLTRALPFAAVNSFSPPLSITNRDIDDALERYARALDAATPELRALAGA
jgi:L-2,4-diaminobutyrate transaminase